MNCIQNELANIYTIDFSLMIYVSSTHFEYLITKHMEDIYEKITQNAILK